MRGSALVLVKNKVALRTLTFVFCLLGTLDCAYLTEVYVLERRVPFFCFMQGCEVVRSSSYSHVGPIPLPVLGLFFYLGIAVLLFAETLLGPKGQRHIWRAIMALSLAGTLASIYLTLIEAFILSAWCTWCIASALTAVMLFCLCLLCRNRGFLPQNWSSPIRRRYVSLLLATVVLSVPIVVLPPRTEAGSPRNPVRVPADRAARLVRDYSHGLGPATAVVRVVEFADFQCPGCREAESLVRSARETYGDRVRFVFRHFLIAGHSYSETAAEATECSGQQGKFFDMARLLFEHQSELGRQPLDLYASNLGLDLTRFGSCMSNRTTTPQIRGDIDDARALGVTGTPTFFVNGWKVQSSIKVARTQVPALIECELHFPHSNERPCP